MDVHQKIDVKRIVFGLALIGMSLFAGFYVIGIVALFFADPRFLELLYEHLSVFIGIPLAGISSFFIVIILEIQTGKIEIEGLGFKFRGASGPVILWIFCFLAMTGAIKLLW